MSLAPGFRSVTPSHDAVPAGIATAQVPSPVRRPADLRASLFGAGAVLRLGLVSLPVTLLWVAVLVALS